MWPRFLISSRVAVLAMVGIRPRSTAPQSRASRPRPRRRVESTTLIRGPWTDIVVPTFLFVHVARRPATMFGHPYIREEGLSWQVEIGAQVEAVTLTDPTPSPSTEGHEPARLASPADVTAVAPVVREYMVGLEVIAIEHSMPADSVVVQAGVPGGRRARRAVRGRQAAV